MRLSARPLVLIAVCGLALVCTACSSNSKKIVGKWKVLSTMDKDGKELTADFAGIAFIMEFTADGNVKVGMDTSGMDAQFKGKMGNDAEVAAKASETKKVARYKVSGNTIEFLDVEKAGDTPFDKKQGGKLSFNGDNLTISGEDGGMKLTRMK